MDTLRHQEEKKERNAEEEEERDEEEMKAGGEESPAEEEGPHEEEIYAEREESPAEEEGPNEEEIYAEGEEIPDEEVGNRDDEEGPGFCPICFHDLDEPCSCVICGTQFCANCILVFWIRSTCDYRYTPVTCPICMRRINELIMTVQDYEALNVHVIQYYNSRFQNLAPFIVQLFFHGRLDRFLVVVYSYAIAWVYLVPIMYTTVNCVTGDSRITWERLWNANLMAVIILIIHFRFIRFSSAKYGSFDDSSLEYHYF